MRKGTCAHRTVKTRLPLHLYAVDIKTIAKTENLFSNETFQYETTTESNTKMKQQQQKRSAQVTERARHLVTFHLQKNTHKIIISQCTIVMLVLREQQQQQRPAHWLTASSIFE